jgi:anaerobic ribonucleoside-triphosphate reductase
MVRTSRLAMEEFDRNKIAEALVKEANVPQDLAQKIARETEGRLSEVKTKYLTAPLIREFVNSILIEKGLEEYRHKLTRLGLPVYDVTQLIKSAGAKSTNVNAVHKSSGDSVIEEYTLLNVLPRDIADAHLSGSLHLNNLGVWILKPNEFVHDLRFWFKSELQFRGPQLAIISNPQPKSLEAAFSTISNFLRMAAEEVSGEQLLEYFNVFLAPFIRGVETDRIRENLRLFIVNLNQTLAGFGSELAVSVGLELAIPNFLKNEEATCTGGRKVGFYSDYVEESRYLAALFLETLLEESKRKPVFQPNLILKMRPDAFRGEEGEGLLHLAHRFAAESGLPYFASLASKERACASYLSTGTCFTNDWKGDWELDALRLGSMDNVVVNLPRIAYESQGKTSKFYELLDEQLEMALRALEIKYQTLKMRAREELLPFLTSESNGEQYARFENFTRLVGFVGLNEAVESLCGKSLYEDSKALDLAEQTVRHIRDCVSKRIRKPESRPVTAMVPCPDAARRLAQLDIERYGWAKVRVKGAKELPSYTDLTAVPAQAQISLDERLKIEARIQKLASGGHLTLLQIEEEEPDSDRLLALSRQLCSNGEISLYAFNRNFAYCSRCRKFFSDKRAKCPFCGSTEHMLAYKRVSTKYVSTTN